LSIKEGESGQRGYLLTGDTKFLNPYQGSYQKAQGYVEKVKTLTVDNATQQQDIDRVKQQVGERFDIMQMVIDLKEKTKKINSEQLERGRQTSDQISDLIEGMSNRERALLISRTERMNRFASATPGLILVASILAILVTIVSFFRVNADFRNRVRLQKVLEQKDQEITHRLNIIKAIAEKISSGDYKSRIDDKGRDTLGSLALSLNKMGESLDYSFSNLSEKEWLQSGIAQLNEKMIGEKNIPLLTYYVIEFIASYTNSQLGAFYLSKDAGTLEISASIAVDKKTLRQEIQIGEGIVGQSALTGKTILIEQSEGKEFILEYSAGAIKPAAIIALPIYHEKKLKGVIELGTISKYDKPILDFLKEAIFNVGLAIHSARDHERLQALLAETQAQSEELQSQHSELENINAELEAQAEKLQTSDEELRVQQEELQQANQELEERSRLLEEKNELILERNLDIQKKAEELEQTTRYKSEFLANMSHELRTPLNSILLLSRLLSDNAGKNLNKDQVEYAEVIQTSGKGLLTLIDEILDLSKIESGKMELDYGDLSLEGFIKEISSLFSPLAKEKSIEFTTQVESGVPAVIHTDSHKLEQVLRNLISNALKFTKTGGAITMKVSVDKNDLSFSIKDTGIGIAKNKQQSIFEAFQQADGSTRRQYGGTGLGLSISRELAKILGGEIKLISEEGKGSEFILTIPLDLEKSSIPVLDDTNDDDQKVPEPKKTENGFNDFKSEKIPASIPDDRNDILKTDKVILIIEDDTAFARSLLDYTRTKGYKGILAVRGDEGVTLANEFLPTGILLDVQLPIKSGWQVMDELKANPATRPIPVHMMSSHQVKNKSLTHGAVDFINKPVAFEQLENVFQKIEHALTRFPKKVLIVEDNEKHAQALAYFLENHQVSAEIKGSVDEGIEALNRTEVDCVILDMGIPAQRNYDVLDMFKKSPGMENLPIIIFTGKNLSHVEEIKIKKYADSIVVKTAQSYQRLLDEVSLFLHLVNENGGNEIENKSKKMGGLLEVLHGKNVLVADDDVRNIFSLSRSLEKYGINVISAIDGKEALKQLEEHPQVDLVLMDMMMPEMDGYESTKLIRSKPRYKNLPIIAVTAKAMTGDREKCISAGASDYITKPVDVDQLLSLLRVWLYQ
jgi:signal transduction histidine kinase/DNA-binding response OmpR family regulator/CHASE3 domain sensor protein